MVELFCPCVDPRCGHQPGERCGRLINQDNLLHPYSGLDPNKQEFGGYICDECWDRVKQAER